MKILAVEFSSERRSVAVVENGQVLGEAHEVGGRAAIALVEKALEAAGIEREESDCIAVGIGPGSYTGIRGAISLAQGWQLGRHVKLLGISSVECIAAQARRDKMFGTVAVVVDAQRQEFYLAVYDVSENAVTELHGLRIVPLAEVEKVFASGARVIGPEADKIFTKGVNMFPEATMLGQLALMRTDFVAGEKLEPIYLREVSFKKVAQKS
jgi:tRNA threonylcarbamoyl adenosine modification protein YeaZ